MQVVKTVAAMRRACGRSRLAHEGPDRLGLVPSMGALHAGHLSLVRRARQECGVVVATIFVNPLQFGACEDFERYPRQTKEDCALLESEGVDLIFLPEVEEMYPQGATTTIDVAGPANRLDGAHRPGHFCGVATVVAKLFHIVGAERAYFGQKDAVQVAVLRQMIRDLNFTTELVACPIVRDEDGLALSSRNVYLSAAERRQALAIPRSLETMQELLADGRRDAASVLRAGTSVLNREPGLRLEFLEAVDPDSLETVRSVVPGTLVAVAAKVGKTRLIDNFLAV